MRTCELGEARHTCGQSGCEANVPRQLDSEVFCNRPHATTVMVDDKEVPIARCRRQAHASGPHSAFVTGVRVPDEWGS
jgi:hypothetical protein